MKGIITEIDVLWSRSMFEYFCVLQLPPVYGNLLTSDASHMLLYVTFFGIPLTQARDRCGQIGISAKYRLVLFDLTITLSNIGGSHQLCVPLWLQQCIATNRIEADFMRFLCSHVSCSPFFCLWCSPSLIVKALLLPQVLLYVRYRLLVFIDKKVFPKWCFRGGKYLRTFSIVTRNVYIVRFYSEHRGLI